MSLSGQIVDPKPIGEEAISDRVERVIHIKLLIRSDSPHHPLPWDSLKIPVTRSVKKTSTVPVGLKSPLLLSILLTGVASRHIRHNACSSCTRRVFKGIPQAPATLGIVDYVASSNTISIDDGVANLAFRLTCYPQHHSRMNNQDSEWL